MAHEEEIPPFSISVTNGGNIMYRDGNFQNLRWNMLEASHKAHWEKLSSVYGLEEPEKLLKPKRKRKICPFLTSWPSFAFAVSELPVLVNPR